MAQVDSGLELGWGSTFAAATTAAAAVLRVLSPGRMNVGGGGWRGGCLCGFSWRGSAQPEAMEMGQKEDTREATL